MALNFVASLLYGRNTSLTILYQSLSEVLTLCRMEIMASFNELSATQKGHHLPKHHGLCTYQRFDMVDGSNNNLFIYSRAYIVDKQSVLSHRK
jgi:hypothetical protein